MAIYVGEEEVSVFKKENLLILLEFLKVINDRKKEYTVINIPVEDMPEYIRRIDKALSNEWLQYSFRLHGLKDWHFGPFRFREFIRRKLPFLREIFEEALKLNEDIRCK